MDYFSEAETKVDKLACLEPMVWPAEQSLACFALLPPWSLTPPAPPLSPLSLFSCGLNSGSRTGKAMAGTVIEEGHVCVGVPGVFHL